MLMKRDSQISNDPTVTYFSIELNQTQYQKIKKKVDLLKEKCPSQCSFKLEFEKRSSCYVGEITINSFSENFYSKKVAHNPYQTYLMLEEDIEQQLLEWKRRRFSANLEKSFNKKRLLQAQI